VPAANSTRADTNLGSRLSWWKRPVPVALVIVVAAALTWSGPGPTKILFFAVFILVLIHEISLISGEDLPPHKKWATGFLLFAAIAYLWMGLLGVSENNEIPAYFFLFRSSAFPIASLFSAVASCVTGQPCRLSTLGYAGPNSLRELSGYVVAVSSIAVFASFAMLRKLRIGYAVWLLIIIMMAIASLWDIAGSMLRARLVGVPFDIGRIEYILTVLWSLSCAGAFWVSCFSEKSYAETPTT